MYRVFTNVHDVNVFCKMSFEIAIFSDTIAFDNQNTKIGILLPKLFWPTVRKKCSSDREKLLKFEAEGWEF